MKKLYLILLCINPIIAMDSASQKTSIAREQWPTPAESAGKPSSLATTARSAKPKNPNSRQGRIEKIATLEAANALQNKHIIELKERVDLITRTIICREDVWQSILNTQSKIIQSLSQQIATNDANNRASLGSLAGALNTLVTKSDDLIKRMVAVENLCRTHESATPSSMPTTAAACAMPITASIVLGKPHQ